MLAKNADFMCYHVEMASSPHTVCRFCTCAVQGKHYMALFSPGGLKRQLPAHVVKLYEVPISFIASLCSFFRMMSPCLTEDMAYDRAASNSLVARTAIVAETEMDGSNDYIYGVLQSSLPKITNTQIFGISVYQAASPLHVAPPPHGPPCAAWLGYEARPDGIFLVHETTHTMRMSVPSQSTDCLIIHSVHN